MSSLEEGVFLTWLGPRLVELQHRPRPVAGLGEVVLKVQVVALCGSDINAFEGRSKHRVPPLVLGHEIAGTVVDGDGDAGGLPMTGSVAMACTKPPCGSSRPTPPPWASTPAWAGSRTAGSGWSRSTASLSFACVGRFATGAGNGGAV